MREPELSTFSRSLPTVSLPAKSPTPEFPASSPSMLQTTPLVTQVAHTCPLGSKKCQLLYTLGGALASKSLIQGLVSTHYELTAMLGPQGRHLPRMLPSRPCPTFPSLDCLSNRKSQKQRILKRAGILMVEPYHFTGEGTEVQRGRQSCPGSH